MMLATVHRMCWARHHVDLRLSLHAPAYGLERKMSFKVGKIEHTEGYR